ncbi:carboxymuconolactone decarboxylase family protein [Mucisphaera calidilacus]|uniref:Carboxymuconolactone decarboxylase family protein n=1 Tax=Mucisphaera calidilacus TaxID=2527982 RepID=A0A518BZZ6_9BACT|nr:carboxymuconolactone decarboxylase family protein [Mucisphaera calidilacus]QDU72546.1 Carboxymuconolactone decarboxylase family protein [Mucisphaera calidilacus]
MARITPVQVAQAQGNTKQLLEGVQKGLGMVPNMMKTMAQSSAALGAYLNFSQALATALNPRLREQIALAVAGINNCSYCASAHTALGSKAGVDNTELAANLQGRSEDPKTQAALRFARAIVIKQGWVSDDELADIREAGYADQQIVEIVAVVALNLFTNYFNHVADTEIDFPVVETADAAA